MRQSGLIKKRPNGFHHSVLDRFFDSLLASRWRNFSSLVFRRFIKVLASIGFAIIRLPSLFILPLSVIGLSSVVGESSVVVRPSLILRPLAIFQGLSIFQRLSVIVVRPPSIIKTSIIWLPSVVSITSRLRSISTAIWAPVVLIIIEVIVLRSSAVSTNIKFWIFSSIDYSESSLRLIKPEFVRSAIIIIVINRSSVPRPLLPPSSSLIIKFVLILVVVIIIIDLRTPSPVRPSQRSIWGSLTDRRCNIFVAIIKVVIICSQWSRIVGDLRC